MYQSSPGAVSGRLRFALRFAAIAASLGLPFGGATVLAQPTSGATTCEPAPARAASVQGTVEVKRVSQTQWQLVKLNDTFCPGDSIRVQEKSRADIALLNQSVLRLNANSTITIEPPKEAQTGVIGMVKGAVHFFSRGPRGLEVQTPFTLAGVRGTEFLIGVDDEKAELTVFEGTVVAENSAGSLSLTDGQSALAVAGKAPTPTVVARPRDAVQWALYYPPVIYIRPDEFPAGSDWQARPTSTSSAHPACGTIRISPG